jgi:hypothetical protein
MPKLEPEWLTSELQTDAPEHEVLLAMGVKEVYAGECQMLRPRIRPAPKF